MSLRSLCWAVAALGVLWVTSESRADSIGINFSGGQSAAVNATPLAPGDVAGFVSQANWNNAPTNNGSEADIAGPVTGALVDNNGQITNAAVAWGSTNTWAVANAGRTPANAQLLNGYLDNTAAATPTTVSVNNIPLSFQQSGYSVYAYVGSDGNGRTGHVTIGAQSFFYSTNSNQNPPTFVQATSPTLAGASAATYAVFTGLNAGSFTLTNTRDSNNVGLHAIQIVQVPEPAAAALLGVAAFGLLARRRRATA